MKNAFTYTLALLSISLLTGCDINKKSNDHTIKTAYPQNKQAITSQENLLNQQKLAGIWRGECYNDQYHDESYQTELTLNRDLSYIYIEKIYPALECAGDHYAEQNKNTGFYKLGGATVGSDGKKAYEFETHSFQNGQTNDKYFMVRFEHETLIFSDENMDNSQPNGKTPQTRNNYFRKIPRITFKKMPAFI